jgi:hypothetical protein
MLLVDLTIFKLRGEAGGDFVSYGTELQAGG